MSTANTNNRVYRAWANMKTRCLNHKYVKWNRYGGRGITICSDWLLFKNFEDWAYNNGYEDTLTLDRINNDGNYEPSNCRWVTNIENCRNRLKNGLSQKDVPIIKLLMQSKRFTRDEIAVFYGITIHQIKDIMCNRSWYET